MCWSGGSPGCHRWGRGGGAQPAGLRRRHSGVLSAYGLALADVVHEAQVPCALPYRPDAFARLDERVAALERECRDALLAQGFTR